MHQGSNFWMFTGMNNLSDGDFRYKYMYLHYTHYKELHAFFMPIIFICKNDHTNFSICHPNKVIV